MTTWTSEDKEEAYRKKVEEAPYHPGYEDAVVTVEPIPFAGMVAVQDKEDTEEMLRLQLRIMADELNRLRDILAQHGIQH